MQQTIPHQQPPPRVRLPELQPFTVDPLVLGRLHAAKAKVSLVWVGAALLIGGLVVWSAAASQMLFRPTGAGSLWSDIWLFISRGSPSDTANQSVPYLRDYPSIVLTFTVIAAVGLVYALYSDATRLHGDLEVTGCVAFNENNRTNLTKKIEAVNDRLRSRWKLSPIALLVALIFMVLVNLTMRSDLFAFLGPGIYDHWWASLNPMTPGGVVWVLFGAVGIYMVYVEAVLGLTYVRFLKDLHRNDQYEFRANMLNPDGFFGWYRLRKLITNMQAGAMCTLLSAWTFSFFLQPAVGGVATVVVLAVFIGVVMYVYISVTANFRHQVLKSKQQQTAEVAQEIAEHERALGSAPCEGQVTFRDDTTHTGLLALLVAYRRLDYISKIPSTPIRQRWLVAGVLSLLGTLSALIVPIIQYFM